MTELKTIIAENITELRRKNGMTQAELAEKLSYSDKAVSKWERGESVPDVSVLKSVAEIFSVTVDYLLQSEHEEPEQSKRKTGKRRLRNRMLITGISILLVWFIATFAYANITIAGLKGYEWLAFVFAVPVSMIVWLVFNSIWFDNHRNFLIISLLMWSCLATAFVLSISIFSFNIWEIFLIGVPAQIIILMWSGIRIKRK